MEMNKWRRVITFFRCFGIGEPITRKEYMERLKESRYTLLDEYRALLEKAGYVKTVKPGVYAVVKVPNVELVYRQLRRVYNNKG